MRRAIPYGSPKHQDIKINQNDLFLIMQAKKKSRRNDKEKKFEKNFTGAERTLMD